MIWFDNSFARMLLLCFQPNPPLLELRIGDEGNLTTVLRRRMHAKPVAAAPGMPCSRTEHVPYWVIIRTAAAADGSGAAVSLDFGIGEQVGSGTVLQHTEPQRADQTPVLPR